MPNHPLPVHLYTHGAQGAQLPAVAKALGQQLAAQQPSTAMANSG